MVGAGILSSRAVLVRDNQGPEDDRRSVSSGASAFQNDQNVFSGLWSVEIIDGDSLKSVDQRSQRRGEHH